MEEKFHPGLRTMMTRRWNLVRYIQAIRHRRKVNPRLKRRYEVELFGGATYRAHLAENDVILASLYTMRHSSGQGDISMAVRRFRSKELLTHRAVLGHFKVWLGRPYQVYYFRSLLIRRLQNAISYKTLSTTRYPVPQNGLSNKQ